MKITIDDKFMKWMLNVVRGYYCNDEIYCSCTDCPYYRGNRKHVQGNPDCTEVPLLEQLMIARKLYERGV